MIPNPDASYHTPNTAIPLNNRPPGEIADIAKEQLKRFVRVSETWPTQTAMVDGRMSHRCRICEQNLWFIMDTNGHYFNYAPHETLALIVAHVRQCHEELVSLEGELLDEDSGKRQVLGDTGSDNAVRISGSTAHRYEYQGGDSRGIEYT